MRPGDAPSSPPGPPTVPMAPTVSATPGPAGETGGADRNDGPLVSIVIPVKDRAGLIGRTLASLIAQSHTAWEAIVVDDQSTDDTCRIVTEAAARDGRIRLVHGSTGRTGAPACRNIGLTTARGEFVVFLDSDDVLTPMALAGRMAMFASDDGMEAVFAQAAMFRDRPGDLDLLWNRMTDEDPVDRLLLGDVPWQTGCAMWRRGHGGGPLARIGLWDERLVCSQDQDFFLRAMLAGVRYRCVDAIDLFVRAVGGAGRVDGAGGAGGAGGGGAGRDSIGGQWWSRGHLLGQRVRIEGLCALLDRTDGQDERRRAMIAGNYYWVARALVHRHGDWAEGVAFWRRCLSAGLIDRRTYRQGWLVLALQRTPLARVSFRRLRRTWPAEMFAFTRGLTRKTRADDHEQAMIAAAAADTCRTLDGTAAASAAASRSAA